MNRDQAIAELCFISPARLAALINEQGAALLVNVPADWMDPALRAVRPEGPALDVGWPGNSRARCLWKCQIGLGWLSLVDPEAARVGWLASYPPRTGPTF